MSTNAKPVEIVNGLAQWRHQAGDKYVVTGVDRDGRRFKQTHTNWFWVDGINLYRGSKWLLRDGKRYRISTAWN